MRTFNRVVAAVVCLFLIAAGLLVVVEIILATFGLAPLLIPYDSWYQSARTDSWDTPDARRLLALLCVAGTLLAILQLVRRRPLTLPLVSMPNGIDAEITRRSLEEMLSQVASKVDGVSGAKTRVSKSRVRVSAATDRHHPRELEPAVTRVVEDKLQALDLLKTPRTSVKVTSRGRR